MKFNDLIKIYEEDETEEIKIHDGEFDEEGGETVESETEEEISTKEFWEEYFKLGGYADQGKSPIDFYRDNTYIYDEQKDKIYEEIGNQNAYKLRGSEYSDDQFEYITKRMDEIKSKYGISSKKNIRKNSNEV